MNCLWKSDIVTVGEDAACSTALSELHDCDGKWTFCMNIAIMFIPAGTE